jgi:hypothetical protein
MRFKLACAPLQLIRDRSQGVTQFLVEHVRSAIPLPTHSQGARFEFQLAHYLAFVVLVVFTGLFLKYALCVGVAI